MLINFFRRRERNFWKLEFGISHLDADCASNTSPETTPVSSQESSSSSSSSCSSSSLLSDVPDFDMTVRNPKLLVQDSFGQNLVYIQYDQLMYFEDIKKGIDKRQTIWEAILLRVGEILKDYAIKSLMFGSEPGDENLLIGFAGFCKRRYAVHLVIPGDKDLLKARLVLSPVHQLQQQH